MNLRSIFWFIVQILLVSGAFAIIQLAVPYLAAQTWTFAAFGVILGCILLLAVTDGVRWPLSWGLGGLWGIILCLIDDFRQGRIAHSDPRNVEPLGVEMVALIFFGWFTVFGITLWLTRPQTKST